MSEMEVGVLCGVCGSEQIHMHPCDECDHVQFSVCFSCGETYHLPGHHHDRTCSKRPVQELGSGETAAKAGQPRTPREKLRTMQRNEWIRIEEWVERYG